MLSIAKIDRQQWLRFFTHLIAIVMIFFLPDLMMNFSQNHHHPVWERMMYFKAAAFVAIFYINYYLIIRRTIFGRKPNYFAFVLWNLLLVLVFMTLFYLLRQQLWLFPSRGGRYFHDIPRMVLLMREWSYVLRDFSMIVLTVALSVAIKLLERWSTIEKRHEQLVASQREEELQSLRNQLNPHFLFNTLNTIYSLIDIDPKEAQQATHQLSRLLRHVLYENPTHQPLSQEVDFVKSYISLMEMRLGSGIVSVDLSHIDDWNIEVAPMIFITMIENAFKHGNTGQRDQKIEISISADKSGVVTCRTRNHFVAGKEDAHKRERGGIGLANLERRLHLIYGDNATFTATVEGDTYTALLVIRACPLTNVKTRGCGFLS